jgi:hypothetical protein
MTRMCPDPGESTHRIILLLIGLFNPLTGVW